MKAQTLILPAVVLCLTGDDKRGDVLTVKVVKIADGDTLMAIDQPPAAQSV